MDITPAPHDKKCWFCAQCGDDLQAIIKLVDAELDEDYRKGAKP